MTPLIGRLTEPPVELVIELQCDRLFSLDDVVGAKLRGFHDLRGVVGPCDDVDFRAEPPGELYGT